MISTSSLTEDRIVKLVGNYMRASYCLTEEELVINSTVLDLQQITGQDVLRIDLAGVSMLDGGIIFIEAETEAFLDHYISFFYHSVMEEVVNSAESDDPELHLLYRCLPEKRG